jgi:hypothetical protein
VFDPARYTQGVRRSSAPRSIRVSIYELDEDRESPERLVLRDESGANRFVTTDGGRSWQGSRALPQVLDAAAPAVTPEPRAHQRS